MTHVVHPYSYRLGVTKDWRSRWFGGREAYRKYLKGDMYIRNFLRKELRGYFVSNIEIERGEKTLRVIIETSRPGMIIGRSGEGSTRLKKKLERLLKKNGLSGSEELRLDIREVKSPESDAAIVAQMVGEGLEKRMPFRRVAKQMIEKVMANRDVKGVKLVLSGRLAGADMARKEKMKQGQIPLQTLRANIDYDRHMARLPYGSIGVQVWIYKGEVFTDEVNKES